MEPQPVTLSTICEGSIEERFAEKLELVLANIDDPNTAARTTRSIVVTLTFSPSEDRDLASVGLQVEARLAPNKPVGSVVHIGRKNGRLGVLRWLSVSAVSAALFNDEPAKPVVVTKGA